MSLFSKKPQGNASRTAVYTVEAAKRKSMTEYITVNIICLLVFIAFGYIALMSFFQTSVIDANNYVSEKILFQSDMIPLNLLLTVLFLAFLFWMRRFYDFFAKVNITAVEIGMTALTVFLGLLWVMTTRSVPAADSYNIFEAATGAAQGNYTSMQNGTAFYNQAFYNGYSYFHFYPFQLGFVAFCEFVYRLFGTDNSIPVQIINVLCTGAAYFALARITKLLFRRKSVEFIACLLLAACLQPVLFCTFAYGNIIGMCGAIWASLLLIKYFQTEQYRWAVLAGVLLTFATLIKYNNLIYLVAFVIMLLIHIVKQKKWQSAVIAAAMIVAVLGSNSLVKLHYENRSGTQFAEGVSQTLYLDMGLQESYMAPGWYGTVAKDTYINYYLTPKFHGDPNASLANANAKAQEDIDRRLSAFGKNSEYALDFFSKKILSQWNEPTFESIWVSKVKPHIATEADRACVKGDTIGSEQIKGLPQLVYYKSLGQALELHFNFYVQMLYIMFAAGIYVMFINKKTNIETVLLPLVLLGAFGYHLLFEGKSQYILTYIPLLIPTAAYAYNTMLTGKYTRIKRFFEKINHIPDDTADIFQKKKKLSKKSAKK